MGQQRSATVVPLLCTAAAALPALAASAAAAASDDMARAASEEGALVAVIADEDTITGFLLAGVGDVDIRKRTNFLIVDGKTTVRNIEQSFKDFTSRDDIAIVLISQPIANMIRHVIANHSKVRHCAAAAAKRAWGVRCSTVQQTAAPVGFECTMISTDERLHCM